MPVNLPTPVAADLYPVAGVRLGVTEAGIRKANRKDLTVVLLDAGASVSAVFTRNRFCAAPVQVCREHLASGSAVRALVINTGNANAGTGAQGLQRARATCAAAARRLGLQVGRRHAPKPGLTHQPQHHRVVGGQGVNTGLGHCVAIHGKARLRGPGISLPARRLVHGVEQRLGKGMPKRVVRQGGLHAASAHCAQAAL